jgi:hypothetical protein
MKTSIFLIAAILTVSADLTDGRVVQAQEAADQPSAGAASGGGSESDGDELPPPLTEYMGRRIAQTMHFSGAALLTRDEREIEEDSRTMLQALKVQPGQTVCDLGCGNGYHTLRLADQVGREGTVLAVDIQQEMLDDSRDRG